MYILYQKRNEIKNILNNIENNTERTFNSLDNIFNFITDTVKQIHSKRDLEIIQYAYDENIDKTVYMIRANKFGNHIQLETHPNFICYLIEI